jgi:molybdopterin-guanine dinucleotide biosynthesis adapter protein
MIPVVAFVAAKSNSGKTTVLCRVVEHLKNKGVRIATLKHNYGEFDIDLPGKDSFRHRKAGARIAVVSSPKRFAYVEEREEAYSLPEIVDMICGVDIILAEGFKTEETPKIEIFRNAVAGAPVLLPGTIALVTDDHAPQTEPPTPVFSFSETDLLGDWIVERFL